MKTALARILHTVQGEHGGVLSGMKRQLNPRQRQFIPPGISIPDFLGQLNARSVSYAVLEFPRNGERNLELLVAASDFRGIRGLLTEWPTGIPIDVYTGAALPRSEYYPPFAQRRPSNRVALFPPYIAETLLGRTVKRADGIKVLSVRDAFLARAFRVAYMGAICCDWRGSEPRCSACKSYEAELVQLATQAEVELLQPVDPAQLDQILSDEGWRPTLDLLEKAARWSPWVRDAFPALHYAKDEPPGVAVFFVRERAVEAGLKAEIVETLKEKGFDLMLVRDLDQAGREKAGRLLRGGNWGPHSYPVSGGLPATVVVGLHLLPTRVSGRLHARYPSCDNLNILRAKTAARDIVNADRKPSEHFNPLHSTDNSGQSFRALRLLLPEEEQPLREQVQELRSKFTQPEMLKDLTRYGSRARVMLVNHQGTAAICKKFRPSALRFMEREIEVMNTLGPVCPEIPKLLERGSDYIIVEYVGEADPIPSWPHPLPLQTVRQLARFIKTCLSHGFDPIDLKPRGNVLLTNSGLKIIDYEFWRRCDPATPPEKSYCLAGLPRDYRGDRPRGVTFLFHPYPTQWFRHTALTLESFLYDSARVQRLKRSAHLAARYARWAMKGSVQRVVIPPLRGIKRALLT